MNNNNKKQRVQPHGYRRMCVKTVFKTTITETLENNEMKMPNTKILELSRKKKIKRKRNISKVPSLNKSTSPQLFKEKREHKFIY